MSYARDCVCAVFECPCHFGVLVVAELRFSRVERLLHERVEHVEQVNAVGGRTFIECARDEPRVDLFDRLRSLALTFVVIVCIQYI